MVSFNPKRDIAFVILFIAGIITTLDYFVTYPSLRSMSSDLQSWGTIIAAFSLGVGTINLIVVHGRRVANKEPAYYNNVVLLIGLVVTILVGLWGTTAHPAYQFIYFNALVPSDTAVWSLLAFYIASAGIRTMKARTKEGAILLITGILVLIKNTPAMTILWGGFVTIGDWLLTIPNVAATRGIMIASAIGIIALGLRVLLGQERRSLGGG
jgi:hypothetical protein